MALEVRQAAALPIRDGQLCLVTSSSGKRWVIPKGKCEPGKTACEIALQEAWEEAGLTGILQPDPLGSYLYEKFSMLHHVLVFSLRVTHEAPSWPEAFRERCWLTPPNALARLAEEGLCDIIRAVTQDDATDRTLNGVRH